MAKRTIESRRRDHDPTALGRRFKQRLKGRGVLLGGSVIEYLRPSLVKLYRNAGYDFIYVENEHAMFLGPQLADFVQAARDNDMPVIAKTAQLDRAEVQRLLDCGIVGIQLPCTESRQDLLTLLNMIKYPPAGTRAGAPCFGNVDYTPPANATAWLKKANAASLLIVHIETRRGYENAEQIVSTPGVDMVYTGPYDTSISMGHPGDYDHPDVARPMKHVLKLCRKYKVPFGTTASSAAAGKRWMRQGCRFFEMDDELTLIDEGAKAMVDSYR